MTIGTVKWFSADIGFGFITPDHGGVDVLVHESALESSSLNMLEAGQKVAFEVPPGMRRMAVNLQAPAVPS